jgi:hypothetical protein
MIRSSNGPTAGGLTLLFLGYVSESAGSKVGGVRGVYAMVEVKTVYMAVKVSDIEVEVIREFANGTCV